MKNNKLALIITGGTIVGSLLLGGTTYAATQPSLTPRNERRLTAMRPSVIGTVSTVSGTIINVTDQKGIVHTVDTTNAQITTGFGSTTKSITVSDISIGDAVAVVGTASGTSISATSVRDGVKFPSGLPQNALPARFHMKGSIMYASSTIPRFVGTITAISGSTFTIQVPNHKPHTRFSGMASGSSTSTPIIYTVVTTNSTVFMKDRQLDSLADLAVGQTALITGTLEKSTQTITARGVNVMTKSGRTQ